MYNVYVYIYIYIRVHHSYFQHHRNRKDASKPYAQVERAASKK